MITKDDAMAVVIDGFSRRNVTVNRIGFLGTYMEPDGVIFYSMDFVTDKCNGHADVYELDNSIFVDVFVAEVY